MCVFFLLAVIQLWIVFLIFFHCRSCRQSCSVIACMQSSMRSSRCCTMFIWNILRNVSCCIFVRKCLPATDYIRTCVSDVIVLHVIIRSEEMEIQCQTIYVYVYVFMYVCIYLCMYACTNFKRNTKYCFKLIYEQVIII